MNVLSQITAAAVIAAAMVIGLPSMSAADKFLDGMRAHDAGHFVTAIRLWRPLAENGDVRAQFNLGTMYDLGQGVARDFSEAVKWFRRAAEQGHGDAQYNLAAMYYLGYGVARDYVKAHKWFNIAGVAGHEKAKDDVVFVTKKMTPAQITRAQKLANEWMADHGKN